MTDIRTVGHGNVGPLDRTARAQSRPAGARPGADEAARRPGDRVELSSHARFLDQLRYLPEVRQGRIEAIRDAIADGTYETEGKIDDALERLADDLTG